jgi:uncharacterized SAM-binding protein YcdF (DUF218 family)
MPRARLAFEHAGFTVTAAPIDFSQPERMSSLMRFAPNAVSLMRSAQALHEYIGRLAYHARIWMD